MRVNVISDVHGRCDGALAAAGEGADALVCLGDLLCFVDYRDHSAGIFGELFGTRNVAHLVALRADERFGEAREFVSGLWAELDREPRVYVERAARSQYARMFAAMPAPAYLTYGNVDLPHLWSEYTRPGHRVLDGEVVEVGGRALGFVGGGLPSAHFSPHEVDEEIFAANIAAVGSCDVLCCHIPPALPDLTYDVVARRLERGSEAALDAIRDTQPAYALFGHVHQPLVCRTRVGRTECVNVGHFQSTGVPYTIEW